MKKRKIDFTNLPVTDVEGKPINVDLSHQIGNLIWNTTSDVLEAELAQRIAKEQELELTDDEIEIVRKNMRENKVKAFVKIAFEQAVKSATEHE